MSLVLNAIYLVEVFGSSGALEQQLRLAGRYIEISKVAVQVVSVTSAVVLLPLVAMVWQLCLFHAFLLYRGITTYEYIVQESKRRKKEENDAKTRRTQELELARTEKARMRQVVLASKAQPIRSPTGGDDEESAFLALKGGDDTAGWTPPASPTNGNGSKSSEPVDASHVALVRVDESPV